MDTRKFASSQALRCLHTFPIRLVTLDAEFPSLSKQALIELQNRLGKIPKSFLCTGISEADKMKRFMIKSNRSALDIDSYHMREHPDIRF